jgi:protein-disulfide isomerase
MRRILSTLLTALAAASLLATLPARAADPAPLVVAGPMSDADRAVLHAEIRAYLLENPEILREMVSLLEMQGQAEAETRDLELVATHSDAIFRDGYSFVGGNPEGSFTVVEFLDHQCGFCRRAHPDVLDLLAEDGDIRWIVKELPILGPGSELAARATTAALITEGPETYQALVGKLMGAPGQIDDAVLDDALSAVGADIAAVRAAMEAPEVASRLEETRALAQTLAITGTPTFVFGDRLVRGYLPLVQMQALVAELRRAD